MSVATRPEVTVAMPLRSLGAAVGLAAADLPDVAVTGVTLRAQDVRPGDLFAALPGATSHGAHYTGQARERGAVAVLTDAAGAAVFGDVDATPGGAGSRGIPVLVHADPRAVLGSVAAAVYGDPSASLSVLGVTGTSGKTTVTHLVEAGLAAAGRHAGLIGTVGVRVDGTDGAGSLTTPEAPDLQALLAVMADRGVDTVAMEVSSHALTLRRVDGVRFAAAGFTNLSRDHLDFHPTMADYFAAKAALFDPASPTCARTPVICVDDDAGAAMAELARDPITVGVDAPAQWRALDVRPGDAGRQHFTAVDPGGARHEVTLGLPGRYNVANALLALALLECAGVAVDAALPGLRDAAVPGRLQPVDVGQDFLALVDYAHKPGALEAVLATLRRQTPGGRLAVVFGAGGDRDPGKRGPMGAVAAAAADLVVVTDDNPRGEDAAAIRAAVLAGARGAASAADIVEVGDRRDAIRRAVGWARAGDVVLVAGKGHETGQRVGATVRPFDDRDELAAALRECR